jgi:hypothetical protein
MPVHEYSIRVRGYEEDSLRVERDRDRDLERRSSGLSTRDRMARLHGKNVVRVGPNATERDKVDVMVTLSRSGLLSRESMARMLGIEYDSGLNGR